MEWNAGQHSDYSAISGKREVYLINLRSITNAVFLLATLFALFVVFMVSSLACVRVVNKMAPLLCVFEV